MAQQATPNPSAVNQHPGAPGFHGKASFCTGIHCNFSVLKLVFANFCRNKNVLPFIRKQRIPRAFSPACSVEKICRQTPIHLSRDHCPPKTAACLQAGRKTRAHFLRCLKTSPRFTVGNALPFIRKQRIPRAFSPACSVEKICRQTPIRLSRGQYPPKAAARLQAGRKTRARFLRCLKTPPRFTVGKSFPFAPDGKAKAFFFPRALAHNRHRGKQHRLPWRAFPTGSGAVSAANTLRSGALRPRKGSRRERQPAACPLAQQRAAPWLRAGFACQRAGYAFRLPKKHARLEARFPPILYLCAIGVSTPLFQNLADCRNGSHIHELVCAIARRAALSRPPQ